MYMLRINYWCICINYRGIFSVCSYGYQWYGGNTWYHGGQEQTLARSGGESW